MIRAVLLGRPMDVLGFVEAASAKRNRERFQLRARSSCRVMENRRGIDSSAEPDAKRNIRYQMLANGVLKERVEFFLGRLEREVLRDSKRYFPIRPRGNFAVAPFQPFTRRKFFDTFHQRPRARDVV